MCPPNYGTLLTGAKNLQNKMEIWNLHQIKEKLFSAVRCDLHLKKGITVVIHCVTLDVLNCVEEEF